ncbi:tail fiber domain-containing protein [Pseudomonas anguilliseptica]|uniref:tail fiber domain-containing protein n=1 Tax=Pseudomonas anguilliseptica TaxID=53406 RepID=UPI00325B31A2
MKTNVRTIENARALRNQLRGVWFDWIKDGRADLGMIAQEVQAVVPELVSEDVKEDGSSTLALNYAASVGLLLQASNEDAGLIDDLRRQLGAVVVRMDAIEGRGQ